MYRFYKEVSKGYLYSRFRGEFKVQEGTLLSRESAPNTGRFYVNEKKYYTCSPEVGTLFNGVVWLPTRNDEFVLDIFIEHEEEQIKNLQEDIKRKKENIKELNKIKRSL